MKNPQCKTVTSFSLAVCLLLAALSCVTAGGNDHRAPEVPAPIQVPDGNKVHFRAYADGVQIYSWTGTAWVFQAPEAILYDADGNTVGIHYGGPTWESNSGSTVVGTRIAGVPSPNANSIPLLLLQTQTADGPGIFARTTYIQRVNTIGGLAPAASGSTIGEEVRVAYTAEYFFYRQQ